MSLVVMGDLYSSSTTIYRQWYCFLCDKKTICWYSRLTNITDLAKTWYRILMQIRCFTDWCTYTDNCVQQYCDISFINYTCMRATKPCKRWGNNSSKHRMSHPNVEYNTLKPRQDDRHFPDKFLRCIFLWIFWISIRISPTLVPRGSINNNPASFQIITCRLTGDKPVSEATMV